MHQSNSDIFNSPERGSAGGAPSKGRSRWGVFSVVLGVLGIGVGWVPFIGFVGIVLGAIGLVLGIRAINRQWAPRSLNVTGTILSALAVILGVVWLFVPVSSLIPGTSSQDGGDSTLFPELKADPFALGTSTSYSLRATATGHAVVRVTPATDGSSPSPAEISFNSSWEKDLDLKGTHGMAITVTGEKDQQVSCSIAVNQAQTRTRTGTGTVTCKVSTLEGDPDHVDEQLAPTP